MNNIFGNSGPTTDPKKQIFNGDVLRNDPTQWTTSLNNYQPQSNLGEKKSIFGQQKDFQGNIQASGQFQGQADVRTPYTQDNVMYQSNVKSKFGPQDDMRISTSPIFQNPMFSQPQGGNQQYRGQEKQSIPNTQNKMHGYQANDMQLNQSYGMMSQSLGPQSITPNPYGQQSLQMNPSVQRLAQSNVMMSPEMMMQSQYGTTSVTPNMQTNRVSVTPTMQVRQSTIVKVDPLLKHSIGQQLNILPYFQDKRVVVTGASSGVGRAVAMWYSMLLSFCNY